MNFFYNKKTKKIITGVIAGVLILTMVLPLIVAAL